MLPEGDVPLSPNPFPVPMQFIGPRGCGSVGSAANAALRTSLHLMAVVMVLSGATLAQATTVPYKVASAIPDSLQLLDPSAVRIDGWLGARIDANVSGRLEAVDIEPLLAGYIRKPGVQPWIGEHIGKWIHAATLAWAYTGDRALREKLDTAVARLIAAQEPDGYLGTYVPSERFGLYRDADWDVWSHAYNMIGLLTYYRYTRNEASLTAARRVADLLMETFPAKRSILAAGTHEGMAATSVLVPIVELYRLTGDDRYLAFARYIVASYDEPGGPRIVQALVGAKGVNLTANGKAYEMLANLMGLCDLARVTGDRRLLLAVTNGWEDIVRNRLYLTGTASSHEHFAGDHELPNGEDAQVGETCVTTTWMQLNLQLLQLTGGAEYADEIERSLYNQLTAAQNPRGDDWCYFTPLEGSKHYDAGITCCHSSGPRALALAPMAAYLQTADTACVSTFESSRARFLFGGQIAEIDQDSGFPRKGHSVLTVHVSQPAYFGIKLRVPSWAAPLEIAGANFASGWATLPPRSWKDGEKIECAFRLSGRVIAGDHTNTSRAAAAWGPFILAVDAAQNPKLESLESLRLAKGAEPALASSSGTLAFSLDAWDRPDESPRGVTLVPFADAGAAGGRYRVWLRDAN
jgi:DUF1680 family protein